MPITKEQIAEWRAEEGNGMRSAVGEYTPDEFWMLLDEIERLQAERQWRPIETAPKDRPILGYADGVQTTVAWFGADDGWWSLCEAGAFAENGEWTPTHWMPLPDPPTGG